MEAIVKLICSNNYLLDLFRNILQKRFKSEKCVIKSYLKNDRKTLDFGCGTGNFCLLFESTKYLGIDINTSCIDYAKKKHPEYSFNTYENRIPSKQAEFENVLICEVLHHIDDDQIHNYLREIKRVAKREARVLIIDQVPVKNQKKLLGKFLFKHDRGKMPKGPKKMKAFIEKHFEIKGFSIICSGPYTLQVWRLQN